MTALCPFAESGFELSCIEKSLIRRYPMVSDVIRVLILQGLYRFD
jgi:hypothetical protein